MDSQGASEVPRNRPANICSLSEVPGEVLKTPGTFCKKRWRLAKAAGGERLGCSFYELQPGEKSWPYHYHLGNEEALFIVAGRGTVRLAGERWPVAEGDYVHLKVGQDGAHQLINDSDAPLRYLCMSTMVEPDITVYEDSGKLGLFAGSAPGGPPEKRRMSRFIEDSEDVDYWAGEA